LNILLVNDDGIDSTRLKFTEKVLSHYGQVTVVAPKVQQSGKSVAISMGSIKFKKHDDYHYAVEGTPADCVTFALYGLNVQPDIVVSGVNNGYNIGVDTMYSGTVGAAMQANYHGYSSIALSADHKGFEIVEQELSHVITHILDHKLYSNEFVLNVNFPKNKFDKSKGIINTKTAFLKYEVYSRIENDTFYIERELITDDIPKDSDRYAIENSYISIAKIKLF